MPMKPASPQHSRCGLDLSVNDVLSLTGALSVSFPALVGSHRSGTIAGLTWILVIPLATVLSSDGTGLKELHSAVEYSDMTFSLPSSVSLQY